MATGPTLREQRRQQTRQLLHEAAMELSAEMGFGRVTVDAISARAGVSPRTFFNHFASKEAAVVMDPPVQLRPEQAERFAAGPTASPHQLLVELVDLVVDQLDADPPDRARSEALLAVAGQDAGVFAAMVARIDAARLELSEAIARRLPAGADEQTAGLVAFLVLAAVRSGLESWARDPQRRSPDSPAVHVRRAVDIVTSLSGPPG